MDSYLLNSLVFLFRKVLDRDLNVKGFKLATKARKLPVVLTTDEIRALLTQMDGLYGLLAGLQYGTGMRLMELIRLSGLLVMEPMHIQKMSVWLTQMLATTRLS